MVMRLIERPSCSAAALATPKRCKDGKELKDMLTAWSLKVAEYEHRFKVIDEAQTFVVREMMPKDIKREILTGPRKFNEIMDMLEIIINEMMAADQDANNDMSYDDVCAIAWKQSWQRSRQDRTKRSRNVVQRMGADEWASGTRDDGGKKGGKQGSKGSTPDWYGDKDKESNGS